GVPPSFSFSSRGDEAYLFSGNPAGDLTGYFHGYAFDATGTNVSLGRYVTSIGEVHFVAQAARTPGLPNSLPKVGPLVISEVMYHPPDNGTNDNTLDEFVELQ